MRAAGCTVSHITRHAVTPVAGAGVGARASPVCLHNTIHNTLCRLHLSVCIIYISEIFIEGLIVTLASCVHARACIIVTLVTADSDLMVCALKACGLGLFVVWGEAAPASCNV